MLNNNNHGYACINMQLAYPKEYGNKTKNRELYLIGI